MGEKTKWQKFCGGLARVRDGIYNFCRRVSDRKFMATIAGIAAAASSGLDPATQVQVQAGLAIGFTITKGVVEIAERWKDVKIAEAKAKNGGIK